MCTQVTFRTVQQLMEVRKELTPFVRRNSNKSTAAEAYNAFAVQERSNTVNLKVCPTHSCLAALQRRMWMGIRSSTRRVWAQL